MSQIRRKDQPILAPSQRTIENAEFLLTVRLGSDHLITGLPSFLQRRFPYSLYPDEDQRQKCHRHAHVPATEHDSLCKQQRDTASTVRPQLTIPFLNSSPHDAAAGRVPHNALRSFPTCVVRNSAGTQSGQLDKCVSLLFSVEIRSPNVKHGYNNVFTLGPPSCVCDHSFD